MRYTPFQQIVANEIERIKSVIPPQIISRTPHFAVPANKYTMSVLHANNKRSFLSKIFG